MTSSRANRYGSLAQRKARDRYGLEKALNSWHDAEYANGSPVQIKAAQPDRRFRLWEADHEHLTQESGWYIFVIYRPRGRGIAVQDMKRVRAQDLDPNWYGAGGHRDQRQSKLSVSSIF